MRQPKYQINAQFLKILALNFVIPLSFELGHLSFLLLPFDFFFLLSFDLIKQKGQVFPEGPIYFAKIIK